MLVDVTAGSCVHAPHGPYVSTERWSRRTILNNLSFREVVDVDVHRRVTIFLKAGETLALTRTLSSVSHIVCCLRTLPWGWKREDRVRLVWASQSRLHEEAESCIHSEMDPINRPEVNLTPHSQGIPQVEVCIIGSCDDFHWLCCSASI